MKLVAVTSCPNGIAHTYMAAEKLAKTAEAAGIDIKVETQGSIGVENELKAEEIAGADGVILATDKSIEMDRFEGKPVLQCAVADAIRKPEDLIQQFKNGKVPLYATKPKETEQQEGTPPAHGQQDPRGQNPVYRSLMNGVSYMIPFVVVGGLLIALSLGLGGEPTAKGFVVPENSLWYSMQKVGEAAFTFMVPILAGFIAVSIVDRPGLAPGMIGGYIAANGSFYGSEAGAGFIGGILAGFIAGYITRWIKSLPFPRMIQPIVPILIIPLGTSALVAILFIFVLGAPIASLMEALNSFLQGMQGSSKVLLALVLGAMIAFDMGGPVNKVAFLFGAAMIAEGQTFIMGAIAAAICTPPLGMGLASLLARRKYHREEQEAGKAALAMGLIGITEGAIPFAAGDPLRVIPSIMAGSMTASVIAMLTGVTDNVPHGGPIVAVVQAVGNVPMFFTAILAGTAVTSLVVNLLKKPVS
ncbi:PTS fructose transporter subunit IIBC [Marinithermofilum abyssi]|uniref:PTS fructose transporter subunit IIBC n=1 Tax=Marinithermofilum abyssi TaxID=1571185 RepID=A0A8J2VJK7_9BACL|nr:PTS fructose transporter subunit IIBC [Marinithermofilum abyssi]GGE24313.1 PTS fructose transporter subunit IIBC [Marinithermofilum abyssi]